MFLCWRVQENVQCSYNKEVNKKFKGPVWRQFFCDVFIFLYLSVFGLRFISSSGVFLFFII